MDRIFERALLYDFYGELLTPHQQNIFESVVFEDMSLGEIAQGVHDLVKRCDRGLLEYEEKLHLVKRFSDAKEKIGRIVELTKDAGGCEKDRMELIRRLAAELLEEW